MSVIISFADYPDQVWKIKNTLYGWFSELILEQCPSSEVFDLVYRAELVHGMVICSKSDSNDAIREELIDTLVAVANEVAIGKHPLPGDWFPTIENQAAVRRRFGELASLLMELRER